MPNQFISLATAVDMTTTFRGNRESILKIQYQNLSILPLSEHFDRAPFDTILALPEAKGIRIYPSMSEDLKVRFIIVATDEDGKDILPAAGSSEERIIERGIRCPDICPANSPLNF
jgi:hypothetical protein